MGTLLERFGDAVVIVLLSTLGATITTILLAIAFSIIAAGLNEHPVITITIFVLLILAVTIFLI